MENQHKYCVIAWWNAGKAGLARCDSAPNAIHFAAPPQFGGIEGRWSPEGLLLSAIAGCFTTTFRALADYSAFNYTDLEVEAEGVVSKAKSGYQFSEIIIRPKLTIVNPFELSAAARLLQKTKKLCLVSRAIGVHQVFDPQVRMPKLAGAIATASAGS